MVHENSFERVRSDILLLMGVYQRLSIAIRFLAGNDSDDDFIQGFIWLRGCSISLIGIKFRVDMDFYIYI